jgi:hypothetical protein
MLLAGCAMEAGDLGPEATETTEQALAIGQDPLATGVSVSTLSSFPNSNADCAFLGCDGFAPTAYATGTRRGRGSNSQLALDRNMYLGDINGDRNTDLIQHEDKRLFVSRADLNYTEISHLTLPSTIQRLIIGDFYGIGWDQVCAVTASHLYCFGIDPDANQEELRLWFRTTTPPIAASDDIIVGNFDADVADEMFIYNKSSGAYKMLEYRDINSVKQLASKPGWTPGNLNGRITANMEIRAGDYDGDGRSDLVAINSARSLLAFISVTSNGNDTFWWQFTTSGNNIGSNEEYFLAKVNGDAKDDLVLHNKSTGAIRFQRIEWNDNSPRALSTSTGQLHVLANSQLRPSASTNMAAPRDNMFLLVNDQTLYSYASATSGSGQDTYWWGWNRLAPNNHYGWPSTKVKKVLNVPCKFSNSNSEPITSGELESMRKRLRDFYWETTFGRIDLQFEATGWVQLDYPSTDVDKDARANTAKKCAAAAGKNRSDYDIVVAVTNRNDIDAGASGSLVTLPTSWWDVFYAAHEIGHALEMMHTKNDSPSFDAAGPKSTYGNPWGVMSAGEVGFPYLNTLGKKEGPNHSAPSLSRFETLPNARIKTLATGFSKQKVWLSAVNRPATGEYNELRIQDAGHSDKVYSLEYRERSGFDRNIPRDTVIIHHTTIGTDGRLLTEQDGVHQAFANRSSRDWNTAERQPGEVFTRGNFGSIKILRFVNHMAEVEITPH